MDKTRQSMSWKGMETCSHLTTRDQSENSQQSLSETLQEVRMIRESVDELKKVNRILVTELRSLRKAITETLPVKLGHTITECMLTPQEKDCYVVVPQSRGNSIGSEEAFDAVDEESVSMSVKSADEKQNIRAMLGIKYTPEVDLNVWLRKG